MLSKSEIVEVLKHETDQISKRYQFKFVYLAGSVAREEHNKWSDIDIFVSFPKFLEMTTEEKYQVLGEINVLFSEKLDKVAVKVLETLPIIIQFNIIKDGMVLYESDPEYRDKFVEDTMRLYYDFKIFRDRFINYAMEARYHDN